MAKPAATVADLYRVPGKVELVGGKLVVMSPTGDLPSSAAFQIAIALDSYARRTGAGRAYTDNTAFLVHLPNRQSFSPDAAYYVGPRAGGHFLEGAPIFAVEVRSAGNYPGPNGAWPPSAPTTSPPVLLWFGTPTC